MSREDINAMIEKPLMKKAEKYWRGGDSMSASRFLLLLLAATAQEGERELLTCDTSWSFIHRNLRGASVRMRRVPSIATYLISARDARYVTLGGSRCRR